MFILNEILKNNLQFLNWLFKKNDVGNVSTHKHFVSRNNKLVTSLFNVYF